MSSYVPSVEVKTQTIGKGPLVIQSYVAQQQDKSRPAFLMIPAAKQNARTYRYIGMKLAQQGVNVHALSLRGHAPSGGRCQFATFERYQDDIRYTLQALTLSNVIIVGHSLMGGCLVQEFARRQMCAGLVVINGCLPRDALACMFRIIKESSRKHPFRLAQSVVRPKSLFDHSELIRKHLLGMDAPEALVQEMLQEIQGDESLLYFPETIHLRLRRHDVRPLKTSHFLSIVGECDHYFPPALSSPIVDYYQALGVQATQYIIAGAHHNSLQTHPEPIARHLYEFWQTCASRTIDSSDQFEH